MQYREDKNTGLASNFNIVDGKFQMTGGKVKAQDNMRMIMHFVGWFREYRQDFCVDILWLLQKPNSYLDLFKNVFLVQFTDTVRKYAGFVTIRKANINNQGADRKELMIGIDYGFVLEPDQSLQIVQYIQQ